MTHPPLAALGAPGFFANPAVQHALLIGAAVAAVSAIVGTFTVLRSQAFAGHALADIGAAGGSGAILLGLSPLFGFVVMNVAAAGVMDAIGERRPRGRDLATGIVLGAALGLAALFLYLDTTASTATGATVTVLFGSIFELPDTLLPVVAAFSVIAIAAVLLLYRPLLLSSIAPDLAAARGVPVRAVGVAYMAALAIAVSLSALSIGAILSTALLVGPAATALRLTARLGVAMLLAPAIGVTATWLGIALAYASYGWPPTHAGWPVSFFVVCLVVTAFLAAQPIRRHGRPTAAALTEAR